MLILAAIIILLSMATQYYILKHTRTRLRPLRWVLPAVPAFLLWRGTWRLNAPFEEYPHDGLGGTLLCVLAGLILAGWGLGWAVYAWRKSK